jgi:RNA polymerase sigma factor (sigma-70 family)
MMPTVADGGERDDGELLEAWSKKDLGAGNELFERHFDSVKRFFDNKVGADTEDLVQATFMSCVEGLARFRKASSFRTFLFGVARNVLREHFRAKLRIQREADFEEAKAIDLAAGPSTVIGAKREQRVLLEALRRLPLDTQVLLELHYWEHLTSRELGEILGINENTARSRIRRARELLQEEIKRVAESEDCLRTTLANLDDWAAQLREALHRKPTDDDDEDGEDDER